MIPNERQLLLSDNNNLNNKNNHNFDFRKSIINNIANFLLDLLMKISILIPILCICSSAVFIFMSQRSDVPKIIKRKYLLIGIILTLAFVFTLMIGATTSELKRIFCSRQNTNRPISFISHNEYEDLLNERQSRVLNDFYLQQSRNSARIRTLNLWNNSLTENYVMNPMNLPDENQRNIIPLQEMDNSFFKNVAPPRYDEIFK